MNFPFKVVFAEKCAWRAIYIHRPGNQWSKLGSQLFVLGFDPEFHQPKIFIGLMGKVRRFRLPHISWIMAAGSKFWLPLYRLEQHILHRIDGRLKY
jgi:hypothetical protein